LYAQLLLVVSFLLAAYQDIRDRAVSDLVWVPAVVGVTYVVYSLYAFFPAAQIEFLLLKVALIGGIALAFTYLGGIGQADAIALAFIAADPYPVSPLPALFATAILALSHIGYEFSVGNARGAKTIPMAQFLREQRWIPKAVVADGTRTEVNSDVNVAREEVEAAGRPDAMVEVRYGVPTVAYLGLGYAIYLVYLLLFNYSVFASLP
jgi:Flp pilus assembly protein protease CpaA